MRALPPHRAIVLDLDGTLYHHPPLRRVMMRELAWTPVTRGPRRAAALLRGLACFRSVREELRSSDRPDGARLERLQYELPAQRLGVPAVALEADVREWMLQRPLRHLRSVVRPDAAELLKRARGIGLRVGVFSDYPVDEKLDALGLAALVDETACATEPEVDAFKPHPRGFQVIAARLGVEPAEVLFVGDRADVDGLGAEAAGMLPVIIDAALEDGQFLHVSNLSEVWLAYRRA